MYLKHKVFLLVMSLVADFLSVIIYRLRRKMQETGDFGAVGNAQPYQCVDAQFRREQCTLFHFQLFARTQQTVEFLDEIGEKLQKDGIKTMKERLERFLCPGMFQLKGQFLMQSCF